MVCGHGLVIVPLTINEALKWLLQAAHLHAEIILVVTMYSDRRKSLSSPTSMDLGPCLRKLGIKQVQPTKQTFR